MPHTVDSIVEVSELSELEKLSSQNAGKVIILDFYATWCGPCKVIAPTFQDLALNTPNMIFVKVDVDEADDICNKYECKLMPTFVFIKNNEKIDILEGGEEQMLRSKVAKHSQTSV